MTPEIESRARMANKNYRIARERRTVAAMVALYCGDRHARGLCPDCQSLLDYALERLARCPFQEGKTTCARCPVHCYRPAMREQIRAVMRHAGPRMIFRHPVLVGLHLLDALRRKPVQRTGRTG